MRPASGFTRTVIGVLLGAAALAYAATSWLERPAGKLNVILLTVESTPRHMIGAANTPNLLAAAREGTTYTSHRAISAWTAPNIVALLSGLDPYAQGIHAAGDTVPRDTPLPLEWLNRQGWRVSGLQPFMLIDQFQHLGLQVEPGESLLGWLAGRVLDRAPFILWHHYLETHLPYAPDPPFLPDWRALLPPGDEAAAARIAAVMTQPAIPVEAVTFEPTDQAAIAALHAGTLRQFDSWFGDFWHFFRASGLRENTILIVTADHGDEHLERGHVGHASTSRSGHLHEEIVHIPLFVWLPPGLAPLPSVVATPTDHLDVLPSLLRWLKQAAGPAPLANAKTRPWQGFSSRAGFAEPDPAQVRSFIAARIEDGWKLHQSYTDGAALASRLYHLPSDPGETRDRAADRPDIVTRLALPLASSFAARRQPDRAADGAAGAAPRWIYPQAGRIYRHRDLEGRVVLRWSGVPDAAYQIDYEAGEGLFTLKGRLDVTGLEKDFGAVDAAYWQRFVVPYGRVRLRVGLAGRDDAWSDWIEVRAAP